MKNGCVPCPGGGLRCRTPFVLLPALAAFAGAPGAGAAVKRAEITEAVQEHRLDPLCVCVVPVGPDGVTTLRFPAPVTAAEGAGLVRSGGAGAEERLFQISLPPEAPRHLSLRALRKGAVTNLNVTLDGRTYVFLLRESAAPAFSVICLEGEPGRGKPRERASSAGGAAALYRAAGMNTRPGELSAARRQGLVDRSRAIEILRREYPERFASAAVVHPGTVTLFGALHPGGPFARAEVTRVVRFPEEDALAVTLRFSALRGKPLCYRPEELKIRAGSRVYRPAHVQASGVIPAAAPSEAVVLLTGGPEGFREELSEKNPLFVEVRLYDPSSPARPGAGAPGRPEGVNPRLKTSARP